MFYSGCPEVFWSFLDTSRNLVSTPRFKMQEYNPTGPTCVHKKEKLLHIWGNTLTTMFLFDIRSIELTSRKIKGLTLAYCHRFTENSGDVISPFIVPAS